MFRTYIVTITSPDGSGDIEVGGRNPAAAGKYALVTAMKDGWGELQDLSIINIVLKENEA